MYALVMDDWRDVTFRVPNIAAMSDEALRSTFPYRDGRWSEAIEQGMVRLGATKLDLNALWSETPQAWSCPCCGRDKASILRVSPQGVLLAQLHEHHDHLEDLIAKRLQAKTGQSHWVEFIPEGTYHLEQIGSRLIARFTRTLVCADCNVAEAKVKSRLRHVDPAFSFRTGEIARFITASPNADHVVDLDVADQQWKAAQADFQARVALAETLIDAVLAGQMTQDRGQTIGRLTGDTAQYWLAMDPRTSGLSTELGALNLRSVARDGFGVRAASATPRKGPSVQAPTDADIAVHDGGRFPELWAKLDASWRCAGCDRDRKSIVRRAAKKGRLWSGGARPHREFNFVEDVFGDCPEVASHINHLICEDCWSLGQQLRQRELSLANVTFTLQLPSIRTAINAAPHANHRVDWDRLRVSVMAQQSLEPAIAEYMAHLLSALSARKSLIYFREANGGDERRAWAAFVHSRRSQSQTPTDVEEDLRFLVAEADRLEPIEA